ncbi:MAG: hypothetical protein JO348_01235 [Alphaproteobacteria bacterium]|nr:hypothetical protein [Alphaproteobacteria bacterium]
MKSHLFAATLVAVMFGGATAALANSQDFTLHNETGYTIREVYISDINDNNWNDDLMGSDVLETGSEQEIDFTGDESTCHWDLKAVFNNGYSPVWKNINLCSVSSMTIHYNAETKRTWATYD